MDELERQYSNNTIEIVTILNKLKEDTTIHQINLKIE